MRIFLIGILFVVGTFGVTYAQIETVSTKDTTTYSEKDAMTEDRFVQATSLRLIGKSKEAIPILQELIKQDKTKAAYYYELARSLFVEKDYDNALLNAAKAVSLEKDNLFFALFEAQIYEKQNNPSMAAEKYEVIIAAHPRVEEYYIKLARLYSDAGMPQKSIDVLDRMMSVLGDSEEALYRKFQAQYESNKIEDGISTLTRLVKLAPDNIYYKERLAGAYTYTGQKDAAAAVYRDILAADPTNARANMALAENNSPGLSLGGKLGAIMGFVQNPDISIDQKVSEIVNFLDQYIQNQDSDLVTPLDSVATILTTLHASDPKAWALAGDIRLHTGDYLTALNCYDKALGMTKKVYGIYDQKMLILNYLKRYDDLRKTADAALDIFPNQIGAYINLAYAQLKQNNASEALSILNTAALMMPDTHPQAPMISTLLAIAYHIVGDKDNADKYFERADQLSKTGLQAMMQVAGMLADFNVRIDLAKNKISAAPMREVKDPFPLGTAAQIDFRTKDYSSAVKWVEKAIANGGLKYPSITELAGNVYYMVKQPEKALNYWNMAKKMGVSSTVLDQKISTRAYVQ